MPATSAADRALNEIGLRFLGRCRERISEMHRLIRNENADDASVFPEIRRLAHQMAGSGGVFRAPEISETASRIERACCRGAADREQLVLLLQDLDRVVRTR